MPGWSHNDTPLENVFLEATADEGRLALFAENILSMCQEYGFDGVDMDWEHPRVDGSSAMQCDALMLALAELTQDTTDADRSLLQAIGRTIGP